MEYDINIYLDILREGILNIRSISKKENFDIVNSEIRHIHNIPGIIKTDNPLGRYILYGLYKFMG